MFSTNSMPTKTFTARKGGMTLFKLDEKLSLWTYILKGKVHKIFISVFMASSYAHSYGHVYACKRYKNTHLSCFMYEMHVHKSGLELPI